MSIVARNITIFALALALPLGAEFVTATPEHVPGTGFDVLLYEPFEFAYASCIGALFLLANLVKVGSRKVVASIFVAIPVWLVWFVAAFLAVGQLHLTLGGKL